MIAYHADTWRPRFFIDSVSGFAVASDSQSLIVGENVASIRRWDFATAQPIGDYSGWATAFAFSADGRSFASRGAIADGNTAICTVNLADGNKTTIGQGFEGGLVNALAVASDGTVARAAGRNEDARLELWDISRSRLRRQLRGHVGSVHAAAFCPTAPVLATGGRDHTVRLWEIGEPLGFDAAFQHEILAVAASNDGSRLAVGDAEGVIRLLDSTSGKERWRVQRRGRIFDIAFSPDGRALVSVSTDAAEGVHIFDCETGEEQSALSPSTSGGGIAFFRTMGLGSRSDR